MKLISSIGLIVAIAFLAFGYSEGAFPEYFRYVNSTNLVHPRMAGPEAAAIPIFVFMKELLAIISVPLALAKIVYDIVKFIKMVTNLFKKKES